MKVGQYVVCIDDKDQYDLYNVKMPIVKEGEYYVIRGFRPSTGGVYLFNLKLEILWNGEERGFLRHRFKVVDESNFAFNELKKLLEELKQVETPV